MKYIVKISNGASYRPDYPYEGTDKDIAIAVASAYIAQNKRVFVLESDPSAQNHLKFNTAEDAMNEYERDVDLFRRERSGYRKFAEWLWSVEKEVTKLGSK